MSDRIGRRFVTDRLCLIPPGMPIAVFDRALVGSQSGCGKRVIRACPWALGDFQRPEEQAHPSWCVIIRFERGRRSNGPFRTGESGLESPGAGPWIVAPL